MEPAEPPQLRLAKRLDAEADAIDTGFAKTFQALAGDRLGIGFERDFGVGGDVERPSAGAKEAADLLGVEERRGPAAEKDRVGRLSLARCLHLARQRADVPVLQRGIEQPAVEVAVVADRAAERNVEVEA